MNVQMLIFIIPFLIITYSLAVGHDHHHGEGGHEHGHHHENHVHTHGHYHTEPSHLV